MTFIPTTRHLDHILETEQRFCQLYSLPIQRLDKIHWSPLTVIWKAVKFLAEEKDARILDIGSGAGKFCLAGAYYKPFAKFYGAEQRQYLVKESQSAREKLGMIHVEFEHKNFTQIDLKEFSGFYFYNSFFENLPGSDKIDDSIEYSLELFYYYTRYLYKKLEEMPAGTKVATYCSWNDEIPPCYQIAEAHNDNLLKFWVKKM